MSDNKTDEPAVPAADQHPLNSEHDETLVEAAETTTEQEKKEKEDTVEAPESHHADVAEKEAVVEERSDSHPLQEEEAPMAASYAYNTSDPWAQQESSLLDDQGQPNAAAASLHSTTPSPTPEQTQPLDPDTSHVKVRNVVKEKEDRIRSLMKVWGKCVHRVSTMPTIRTKFWICRLKDSFQNG